MFGARLARVADQADAASELLAGATGAERLTLGRRLDRLRLRAARRDAAVVLAALAGVPTCGAVLTLFVGALREAAVASVPFAPFGAAILCTLFALVAFGIAMLLASRAVRDRVALRRAEAGPKA